MRKFFITLFVFSIPMVIALYPIDVFISKNLLKSNKYPGNYTTWNVIYNGSVNSDILIYGSSRATHHISPNIIEDSLNLKAYNFGVNGHNFWLQYLKHLEYLKHNKAPKHIILSVSFFSLEKKEDLYQMNQFLPYMLYDKNIKEYTSSYQGFSYLDYYVPSLRYFGNSKAKELALIFAFKGDSLIPYKNKGYKAIDEEWNNDLSKARSIMEYYEIKLDKASVDLFDQFLMECKANGIKVSMVYTPEFLDGQNFVSNRNIAIDLYHKYAQKYKIPFLDYSRDSMSYDKIYFNNSMHLNKTGAELFTKKLAHDLRQVFKIKN